MCIFLKAKSIVVGRPWAIDQALRERWIHPTCPPKHRWATDPSSFQCFGCSDFSEGEGVRINPNIVRIVMYIEIYGRSLRGMVAREGFVFTQNALSVTRNVVG